MKEIQAQKILAALEKWCEGSPHRVVTFAKVPTGWRVHLVGEIYRKPFGGQDLQDALAQAATVAELEEP